MTLKIATGLGELSLKAELYQPLLEFLAKDNYRPKSVTEMRELPAYANLALGPLMEAIIVLCGGSNLAPVQEDASVAAVEPS